jgi:putative ABC transport system permease protein
MPAAFVFIDSKVQAWTPLAFTDEQKTARYSNNWAYLGRLRPGATLTQAQAQVDALGAANLERLPETRQVVITTGMRAIATRLQDDLGHKIEMLYLLWGGALFVLLIGCVNVASLVLVRSRARRKELATRMALGAGRWRIVRQLVTEHVLLTTVSALSGLLVGYAALRLLGTIILNDLPGGPELTMDLRIVATTLMTAALIGIVLGAIPVVGGLPTNLTTTLRKRAGQARAGAESDLAARSSSRRWRSRSSC